MSRDNEVLYSMCTVYVHMYMYVPYVQYCTVYILYVVYTYVHTYICMCMYSMYVVYVYYVYSMCSMHCELVGGSREHGWLLQSSQ